VNNLALERKGGWIIKDDLPPLVVPGGVFFVDNNNTIRQLIFSQDILAYESLEQTIFSNHLFKDREIKSWAFQDGIAPVIIVTFSDGDFATFTYNFEHQMRAWTRHDSKYPIEQVEGSGRPNRSFFVVNKDGNRSIEITLPRRNPARIISGIPDADKFPVNTFMDSIECTAHFYNYIFDIGEKFTLTPVTPGDWEGELVMTTNTGLDFSQLDVDDVLRMFNPTDKTAIDLKVSEIVSNTVWKVIPSEELSPAYANILGPSEDYDCIRVYQTFNEITGLDHLEGEEVAVVVDGSIAASPFNDEEGYPTLTVTGGKITLPEGQLGAIINVGRPIVADTKTLNISTVEQSPTLIESINCNKIYIRVHESRGLYCSNKFPEEHSGGVDGTSVKDMEALDEALVPSNDELLGNKYLAPISKRIEKTLPGSWDNQGQIAIRQVDPFHFELLSIIPDLTVLTRSDR
jgi:hypothetical protein